MGDVNLTSVVGICFGVLHACNLGAGGMASEGRECRVVGIDTDVPRGQMDAVASESPLAPVFSHKVVHLSAYRTKRACIRVSVEMVGARMDSFSESMRQKFLPIHLGL